jgi:NAD(P)-dependent dehydrogenase (short-subunit alcohol dehydrogenase family)
MRAVVFGASGVIGRAVVPELARRCEVVAVSRRARESQDGVVWASADATDPTALDGILRPDDVVVYLVHSLGTENFEETDRRAAETVAAAAARAGARQIVYLGGLGADDQDLSAHLRSRREVEGLLGAGGVPVTVLRAGIVVGRGGVSWELTRQLVKNLPAMVVPRWAATRTQPIAVDDVIRGPETMTYVEMLEVAAEVARGHRTPIVRVPVLTPRLSSYWLSLVTDVDVTTGRNLIDSMGTEVVVTDHSIRELVPIDPTPYDEAVRRALEDTEGSR